MTVSEVLPQEPPNEDAVLEMVDIILCEQLEKQRLGLCINVTIRKITRTAFSIVTSLPKSSTQRTLYSKVAEHIKDNYDSKFLRFAWCNGQDEPESTLTAPAIWVVSARKEVES